MKVDSTALLVNGLQTTFTSTYRDIQNRDSHAALRMVCDVDGVTSDNREKTFGYRESAPYPSIWNRGEKVTTEGMTSNNYTVEAFKWGVRLEWPIEDEEDDQTQTLFADAQAAGRGYALHAERMFFDAITGGTSVLPYTLSAPDGSDPFVTSTRFGASGGNTVTSYGVSTTNDVLTGYYGALSRFRAFQDTKGQPLWTPDVVDAGVVFIYSSDDGKVVEEAFKQRRQGRVMGTDAGTTPSNIVQDASRDVTLWGTSRVPTGTAYVFLKDLPVKTTFVMNRTSLQEKSSLGSSNNSDLTAETDTAWVQWRFRQGFGVNVPYGAIKLT